MKNKGKDKNKYIRKCKYKYKYANLFYSNLSRDIIRKKISKIFQKDFEKAQKTSDNCSQTRFRHESNGGTSTSVLPPSPPTHCSLTHQLQLALHIRLRHGVQHALLAGPVLVADGAEVDHLQGEHLAGVLGDGGGQPTIKPHRH